MFVLALVKGLPEVMRRLGIAVRQWRRPRALPDLPLQALEFVAIDLETTGPDPRTAMPVALAAIPFVSGHPQPAKGYATLVNPGREISPTARAIHGISDQDVREAPSLAVAFPAFLTVCRERPLVAHGASFDLTIINRVARTLGLATVEDPVLDIGALAHALLPSWWDLSLDGLSRLAELEPVRRHTAEGDAITAGIIFLRMIPWLQPMGASSLAAALRLQRRSGLIPDGPSATAGGLAGP